MVWQRFRNVGGASGGFGLGGFGRYKRFDDSIASAVLRAELFAAPQAGAIYLGAIGVAARYRGARTEAQLYLGAGNLWP